MVERKFCRIFILTSMLFLHPLYAQEPAVNNQPPSEQPPNIGNFALPPSQQPIHLIGTGNNIIGANQVQLIYTMAYFRGPDTLTSEAVPSILYGIRDDLSILLNVPVALELKDGNQQSSGLQDTLVQFEYAYYGKSTHDYADQATLLLNMTFPTGSSEVDPATGFGAPSYLLGATFNRTYTDWLMFCTVASVLTTSDNATKFGNQYLYEAGFGKNIYSVTDKWITAWIIDINGRYSETDRIHGEINPDSGGNTVYVLPSLWVSSSEVILQAGIGAPVVQNLFGEQQENDYLLIFSMAMNL